MSNRRLIDIIFAASLPIYRSSINVYLLSGESPRSYLLSTRSIRKPNVYDSMSVPYGVRKKPRECLPWGGLPETAEFLRVWMGGGEPVAPPAKLLPEKAPPEKAPPEKAPPATSIELVDRESNCVEWPESLDVTEPTRKQTPHLAAFHAFDKTNTT